MNFTNTQLKATDTQ